MRIAILQLARLGDVLQTLPTIQGLKKRHPGVEIHLIVRDSFSDSAQLSPHVDKVVELSSKTLLGSYFNNPNPETKANAYILLRQWIVETFSSKLEFDLLINLTFSNASSYLAEFIPAKEKRGIHRAVDRQYWIEDVWSQYFYAQVLRKNMNALHLNDIFMRIAGVGEGAWPLELKEVNCPVPLKNLEANRRRVGIQMSASSSDKTFDETVWRFIIKQLLTKNQHIEFVFFGSHAEKEKIDSVICPLDDEQKSRCLNLAGTMKFHENIVWVKSCSQVISHDTAMIHLASIANTQVICISLGDVRAEETGPYGEGHIVLYPAKATLEELTNELNKSINHENPNWPVAVAKTKFITCVNKVPRSELVPINFRTEEVRNFFTRAYYLLAEFRNDGRQEDLEIPEIGDPSQKGALERLTNAYDSLCAIRKLAEFGQHYCVKMLELKNDPKELNAFLVKLNETDEMLKELHKSEMYTKPLIDTWMVTKENISTSDLETLLALNEGNYRELAQNVEIVQQLLQTSVSSAHDKASSHLSQLEKDRKVIQDGKHIDKN